MVWTVVRTNGQRCTWRPPVDPVFSTRWPCRCELPPVHWPPPGNDDVVVVCRLRTIPGIVVRGRDACIILTGSNDLPTRALELFEMEVGDAFSAIEFPSKFLFEMPLYQV